MQSSSVASLLQSPRPAASRTDGAARSGEAFSSHLDDQGAARADRSPAPREPSTTARTSQPAPARTERPAPPARGRDDDRTRPGARDDDPPARTADAPRADDPPRATKAADADDAGRPEEASDGAQGQDDKANGDKESDAADAARAALVALADSLPDAPPPVADPATAPQAEAQGDQPVQTPVAGQPGFVPPAADLAQPQAETAQAGIAAVTGEGPRGRKAAAPGLQDKAAAATAADDQTDEGTTTAAAPAEGEKPAAKALPDALKALAEAGKDRGEARAAAAEGGKPASTAPQPPQAPAAPSHGAAAKDAAQEAKAEKAEPGAKAHGADTAAAGKADDVRITVTTLPADNAPPASQLPSPSADMRSATALANGVAAPAQTPVPTTPPTTMSMLPIEIGLRAMDGLQRFEIRLDPDELGRIDVRLDIAGDGGIKAHLTVDRVETLALLQRDARTLERAFEQAGLNTGNGGLQFSLGSDRPQGGRQQQDDTGGRANALPGTDTNETAARDIAAALRSWGTPNGGLDIRI